MQTRAYALGANSALSKLGMAATPAVSLSRRPPAFQPAAFAKSKPATSVTAPLPPKKEYGAPPNATAQAPDSPAGK